MILGRQREQQQLADLVLGTRQGRSGSVVLRGPAGIGKSTLLDDLAHTVPPDVRVLRVVGVESEVELCCAGLHQVLRPLLPRLDRLPDPQAEAIRAAFGLGSAPVDRFLLSLAALTLLSDACEEAPVAVLVDDAHRLDPASADALVFIARRIEAEGLAMVFAARDGCGRFDAPGLPELALGPLPPDAAEKLLARTAPEAVRAVRQRLLHESEGNPLALCELPAALTAEQLRGGSPLPEHLPLNSRLQQIYSDRTARLSDRHSDALLLAAIEHDGDLTVILGASDDRDAATADLYAAAAAGLIELDEQRVRFRHPLVRSALYQAAPVRTRHAAHQALARSLDADDERRVWHLAAATMGADDTVADLLAHCADRSRRAGGVVTAGHALRRAAAFATSPRARARWLIDAAACAWEASDPAHALPLLDEAETLVSEPALRARSARVRGTVIHAGGNPALACRTLLDGARLVLDGDAGLAEEMLVLAARSAWVANRPQEVARIAELLERTRSSTGRVPDHFRAQLAYVGGLSSDAAPRTACPAHDPHATADRAPLWYGAADAPPWMWPPSFLPHLAGDTESTVDALQRAVATLRKNGAVGALPLSVLPLVSLQLVTGQWTAATALATEALRPADETGQRTAAADLRAVLAWVAAARGDGDRCRELAEEALDLAVPQGNASTAALAYWALGLNALAEGKASGAARLFREVTTPGARAEHFMMSWLVLPDLVEAYVRAGQTELARSALEQLERCAAPADVPALHPAWQRCRALLAADDAADALFAAALAAEAPSAFEAGRTHLLYGEWLRRARRIKSARDHLHQALRSFQAAGATPWAELARCELRAAGEQVAEPAPGPGDGPQRLTPRELQIVRLAAQGMSNSDIAAQLFLSPRTVGHHLYKVFPKLGITSRHQLRSERLESAERPSAVRT
ncbi:helix-turn-helix transcriptional regulator [Streptomyces sp. NPDC039016]|uniref:helix-turn-helix transcriptional regulator n=1 Tax=Streptomyces sp. NPDC039016 TaxID=3154330 RepID=UPI0033EEE3FF